MMYDKFLDVNGNFASDLNFLARATNKEDETRYVMEYIHIEPSEKSDELLGVATDGRHLHLIDPLNKSAVEMYGITPGYWQVLRTYKKSVRIWIARLEDSYTSDWKYPNWKKVVPTGEAAYKTTFEGFTFDGHNHHGLAKFIHGFPDETAMRLNYLQSLGIYTVWNVEWYSQTKLVKFTEGNRMALIMPLQPY